MHTSLQGLKCDTAAIISMLYCFSTVSLYQDKRRRVNGISGWKQHLMGRYILPKQGYIIICLQCKSIGCCKLPILLLPKMAKMNYYDLNNPSVPHLLCFEGQPMWRWGREWQPVYVVSVQSRCFFFLPSHLPQVWQKISKRLHSLGSQELFRFCFWSCPIYNPYDQESYLCPSFWGEADGKGREGCWCKVKKMILEVWKRGGLRILDGLGGMRCH